MRSVWCNPCDHRITDNDEALIAHARRHGAVIMWSGNGGDFIGEPEKFNPITVDEVIDLTGIAEDEWTSALKGALVGQVIRS